MAQYLKNTNWTEDTLASGGIGNVALYRMVQDYPAHNDVDVVKDKLMIIGRVYAASVQRGAGEITNEAAVPQGGFFSFMADHICQRGTTLDTHIKTCANLDFGTTNALKNLICAHRYLDDLLIQGIKEWRLRVGSPKEQQPAKSRASFASKYLHFHAPNSFFIMDSIALKRLRDLKKNDPKLQYRTQWPDDFTEDDQTHYAKHCLRILDLAAKHYQAHHWTPRSIDGHLLNYIEPPEALMELYE